MPVKIVMLSVLLFASLLTDIRNAKIENRITFTLAFMGMMVNTLMYGLSGFLQSIAGWCFPVAALFLLFALRMLGAGDIKLFGAVGAIMGVKFAFFNMGCSFICGGVIGICLLFMAGNGRERLRCVMNYFRCCFLTSRLWEYSDFSDNSKKDKFRFSYAVIPGTAIQFIYMIGINS